MKTKYFHISLVVIMSAVILSACSVSKEARKMKHAINGNWVLETVITEGVNEKMKVKIFNEAEFGCFIGSEWNFVSKKNNGSYTIVDRQKNCPAVKRSISWSFNEIPGKPDQFLFKRLDDKNNPMDNVAGFMLTISQLDKKRMKLKSDILYEGQPASVIYNFVKH